MKTRGSPPAPPPIHVHVADSTPVHVHMRRNPSKTPPGTDASVKRDESRPKIRTPWIPPGIHLCKRNIDISKPQTSRSQIQSDSGIRNWRAAGQQEEELHAVSEDLKVLLREHGGSKTSEACDRQVSPDVLLRTLVEAEIDGVAVANQLTALKETIDSLAKKKELTKLHTSSLAWHQKLLLEKIAIFDKTNHTLRDLLRDWSVHKKQLLVWPIERDTLSKKLADTETENMRLAAKLSNKEKEVSKLAEHLDFEKDNFKTTEELSRILDSTHNHLVNQLEESEAEKVRLSAQIQVWERRFHNNTLHRRDTNNYSTYD